MDPRGRSCPLSYRYQPQALAEPARLEADTLYVVGGLYGNPAALRAVLERAGREPGGPATIVFNGDSHWLDTDPEDFVAISEAVLAHHAIRGNVEAELASEADTGCGCRPRQLRRHLLRGRHPAVKRPSAPRRRPVRPHEPACS